MADNVEEMHTDDSEYSDMEDYEDIAEEDDDEEKKVYLPRKGLEEGEELVCDKSAYDMYHQANAGAACLSFDIMTDEEVAKDQYPARIFAVTGSQADSSKGNHLIALQMSNLHETKKTRNEDEDSEDEDTSSDEDEEEDEAKRPVLACATRQHRGGINRVRYTKHQDKQLAATWSEHGSVHIWDLKNQTQALKNSTAMSKYKKDKQLKTAPPLFSFSGYMTEGFALDWSVNGSTKGNLLTGDCKGQIFLLKPVEGGYSVDQRPFAGHKDSVEEVLWYEPESTVFASCSVDKSIRLWDTRSKAHKMEIAEAHSSDVNVMSWNKKETNPILLSGGDDCVIKVWDLRKADQKPLATFKHHTAPITSIEWNPNDKSVFAAAGADDQITIWDLGMEKDDSDTGLPELKDVPPQLLFIHQGQQDIKELHWHEKYQGMIISTAADGFNIFKTISA